jgi:hypothetical protein
MPLRGSWRLRWFSLRFYAQVLCCRLKGLRSPVGSWGAIICRSLAIRFRNTANENFATQRKEAAFQPPSIAGEGFEPPTFGL